MLKIREDAQNDHYRRIEEIKQQISALAYITCFAVYCGKVYGGLRYRAAVYNSNGGGVTVG